jgi:hypothetical protein
MRSTWKVLLSILVFAVCVAPTLVSYEPYLFAWDDSDYLWRSIAVSKAFWLGHRHELGIAMRSIRPPVMTLLGLPWGPLASWDAAGKCFITLTALTALLVACCLFLLLRVGVKPLYLTIASLCAFAALGPYPKGSQAHFEATGFLADSLFAWNALAAILLIPYEATSEACSTRDDVVRGLLWGVIFSMGAITKVSFLYFIGLVIPVLFIIRARRRGLRSALVSLVSLTACSLPVAIYWLRYGLPTLKNGWAASFGHDAPLYDVPLWQFLGATVRDSPGLLLSGAFAIACIGYWAIKRRDLTWDINLIPLLITMVYFVISLASANRELRYSYVGIIGPPFLLAILMSGKTRGLSRGSATIAAALVFCYLVVASIPTLNRADRRSIARSEAVLTEAARSNSKRILLATDSPSLNLSLMTVAIEVSPSRPIVATDTLAWRAAIGSPIEDDFREIRGSDLIVFQSTEALDPPFTNQRVPEYEEYTKQHISNVPIKVVGDIRFYLANRLASAGSSVESESP